MNHSFELNGIARGESRREQGFSLVELLVALTIGGILIFGATQAYVDSRNAYAVNETVSRMQETARYAISVMEPDLRMSNYWGLIKGAEIITGKASKTDTQSTLGGLAATQCGNNFGLDLENNIEGTEGTYAADCAAYNGSYLPNSDTVTVRRAAVTQSATTPVTGPLRICSSRASGVLVTDTTAPLCVGAAAAMPAVQINDLVVNLYYVDTDSDQHGGVPSLRRWSLDATPSFQESEVVPGIEDMQIQYGVDLKGGLGPTGGAATQYLNAGPALTAYLTDVANPAQIVSVRIWLLVRADTPEVGFNDGRVYEYGSRLAKNGTTGDLTNAGDANKAYQPSLNADDSFTSAKRYRRVLVSRTILVRNAIGT